MSRKLDYPKNVVAVYDNGGVSADRYTVYYSRRFSPENNGFHGGRGMNAYPTHPQGIGMYITGQLGKHNGKRIKFAELPEECKNLVNHDLTDTQ